MKTFIIGGYHGKSMEKLLHLQKQRICLSGSEIYGGLAILGIMEILVWSLRTMLKAWWKKFVQENPYNVGVDCAILMIHRHGWLQDISVVSQMSNGL